MSATLTTADRAVEHLLNRIRLDGRLAWLIGFGTESFALLTQAYAEREGRDVAEFRREFLAQTKPIRIIAED